MNIAIIGATSGIGRELWNIYSASGQHKVAVVGRRATMLDEMKGLRPENTLPYAFDLNNYDKVESLLAEIRSDLGTIDLAIVCAGTGDLNPDLDFGIELATISTNILGWTAAVDALYHLFSRQGCGHLATLTSIGGLAGEPAAPAYSATKAYQINYTQALRKKCARQGIHVTEIRPGLVDTAMAKGEGLFWVMPAKKVARQIASAISKKKKSVVVTKRWRPIAFILKHFIG